MMIDYLHIVVCVCVSLAALGVAIERLAAAWLKSDEVQARIRAEARKDIRRETHARVIEGKAKKS